MKPRARGLAMSGRLLVAVGALLTAAAAGCSRNKSTPSSTAPSGGEAGSNDVASVSSSPSATTPATADAGPLSLRTEPVFSAPIAAARSGGSTVVAGLVADSGVLRVVGFRPDGSSWSRDVLTGLTADPDAEVKVDRAGEDGVALVWKGNAGAGSAKLTVLGASGDPRLETLDIGADWCSTAAGIAWIESRPHGSARVLWRSWSGGPSRGIASIAAGRTPSVVCGEHDVYTLGDGDDDLTAEVFVPDETTSRPPSVILRSADFPEEEVDHRVYTVDDDLQIVRLGESGILSIREVPASGPPRPWRNVKRRMAPNEDIVAVDGDSTATVVASTREREEDCPNAESPAEQVGALRIDRTSGTEVAMDLAPADCARSLGPFWIAQLREHAPLVAWVERRSDPAPGAASIRGLAYAVLGAKHPETNRFAIDADALVDAGCDASGCFAAALLGPAPQSSAPAPAAAAERHSSSSRGTAESVPGLRGHATRSAASASPASARLSPTPPSTIVVFEYPP